MVSFNPVVRCSLPSPRPFIPPCGQAGQVDRFERLGQVQFREGPLSPGTLPPPDPTLGAPVQTHPGNPTSRAMQEAATAGAFTVAGAAVGTAVGAVTIPGLGAVPGEMVGGFVGGCLGAAWNAIF